MVADNVPAAGIRVVGDRRAVELVDTKETGGLWKSFSTLPDVNEETGISVEKMSKRNL